LVCINGHTDSMGDDGYNNRLSDSVVAQWFFKRAYLKPSEVKTQAFGKSQPAAPNTTAEGQAKNRRVEIYLSNK
jgi:outer membrane protein OmpA-like peptidoglycan-associated protein